MRRSQWTPSIVPRDDDFNVYMVLDDLGQTGRSVRPIVEPGRRACQKKRPPCPWGWSTFDSSAEFAGSART